MPKVKIEFSTGLLATFLLHLSIQVFWPNWALHSISGQSPEVDSAHVHVKNVAKDMLETPADIQTTDLKLL